MASTSGSTVRAAGCVVWRYGSDEPEVLVVHRRRWDDWSFPKGKLEPGECSIVAAAREVEEETGLRVKLGPRLRDDRYTISTGQPKVVSYWIAQPPPNADVTHYEPNDEIDDVRWLTLTAARATLTYPRDVELLTEFSASAFDSTVLLVVRHAEARERKTWHGDDGERPLAASGRRTADSLAPVLAAYGVRRVITSDAARCVDTVLPFVNAYDVKARLEPGLSEDGVSAEALRRIAGKALATDTRIAICTHRPVLPKLCQALGIRETPLDAGSFLVIHRSAGQIHSAERPESCRRTARGGVRVGRRGG